MDYLLLFYAYCIIHYCDSHSKNYEMCTATINCTLCISPVLHTYIEMYV